MTDGLPQNKVTLWLLGIVAAGFLSWSVAIYRAIFSVEILADKMLTIEQELGEHEDRPWHNEAGHMIRLQSDVIDRIEIQQKQILEILNSRKNAH